MPETELNPPTVDPIHAQALLDLVDPEFLEEESVEIQPFTQKPVALEPSQVHETQSMPLERQRLRQEQQPQVRWEGGRLMR